MGRGGRVCDVVEGDRGKKKKGMGKRKKGIGKRKKGLEMKKGKRGKGL
jgi:hypothetical protein